jgi:hypothetical protein
MPRRLRGEDPQAVPRAAEHRLISRAGRGDWCEPTFPDDPETLLKNAGTVGRRLHPCTIYCSVVQRYNILLDGVAPGGEACPVNTVAGRWRLTGQRGNHRGRGSRRSRQRSLPDPAPRRLPWSPGPSPGERATGGGAAGGGDATKISIRVYQSVQECTGVYRGLRNPPSPMGKRGPFESSRAA